MINSIFYFVWRLFNLSAFISYLLSTKIQLNRKGSYTGFLPEIEDISTKIKEELMENNEFLNHIEKSKKSTDPMSYIIHCVPYLSKRTKDDILKIAQKNVDIVTLAQNFLGIKPTLNRIEIYANIPKIGDKEIGSKMWHRDSQTFLEGDFMFAITNITDENGPFHYIDPDDFGSNRHLIPKVHFGWESGGRFSTEELIEYGLNPETIKKFVGKSGSYLILNAGEAYHRGGYCKSEMRILGRFIYSGFGDKRDNLSNFDVSKSSIKEVASKFCSKFYDFHEKIYRNILKGL
jgi:hypothetical protein